MKFLIILSFLFFLNSFSTVSSAEQSNIHPEETQKIFEGHLPSEEKKEEKEESHLIFYPEENLYEKFSKRVKSADYFDIIKKKYPEEMKNAVDTDCSGKEGKEEKACIIEKYRPVFEKEYPAFFQDPPEKFKNPAFNEVLNNFWYSRNYITPSSFKRGDENYPPKYWELAPLPKQNCRLMKDDFTYVILDCDSETILFTIEPNNSESNSCFIAGRTIRRLDDLLVQKETYTTDSFSTPSLEKNCPYAVKWDEPYIPFPKHDQSFEWYVQQSYNVPKEILQVFEDCSLPPSLEELEEIQKKGSRESFSEDNKEDYPYFRLYNERKLKEDICAFKKLYPGRMEKPLTEFKNPLFYLPMNFDTDILEYPILLTPEKMTVQVYNPNSVLKSPYFPILLADDLTDIIIVRKVKEDDNLGPRITYFVFHMMNSIRGACRISLVTYDSLQDIFTKGDYRATDLFIVHPNLTGQECRQKKGELPNFDAYIYNLEEKWPFPSFLTTPFTKENIKSY